MTGRNRLRFGICFVTLLLMIGSASAAEFVSVVRNGVNLRAGASGSSTVLFELPAGYPLQVLEKKGSWYKVQDYEGDKGWISNTVVNDTPHVVVKAKECNIRKGPATNEPKVGKSVKDVIFVKVDEQGDWIKISHPDLTGWIHKSLVWP